MLCWNQTLWLDVPSQLTHFNQSDCIILVLHSYYLLKVVLQFSGHYDFWVVIYNHIKDCPQAIGYSFQFELETFVNEEIIIERLTKSTLGNFKPKITL